MFGLRGEDIVAMNQCFEKYSGIEMVVVYGSRAKDNYKQGSDIDLTIQGDITLSQLLKLENELDDLLLPYKIDLSLINQINNPDLLAHIERAGKVFYSRSHKLILNDHPIYYKTERKQ